MSHKYSVSDKAYSGEGLGSFSLLDMLNYFSEQGAMRVSDLHIKVGAPPTYRIDGDLVRLKGPPVSADVALRLVRPLATEDRMRKLDMQQSIDAAVNGL